MPVDQTGETILFAIDQGYVEAHIQIEYDGGDADQFAWLVPVPEVPEVEVGSWRLVQAALDGTQPSYGFEDNRVCDDPLPPNSDGDGFFTMLDAGSSVPGPEVVVEDVVGAFEYAVLAGGSSATVTQWLIDNGYAVESEAPRILDEYIAEGHVFVAFRLRHGQGVEDIHPVVVRYQGVEPCIPLRLTRVAAQDDMNIRALFLGESRVVPTNYREVVLNPTRLNWSAQGANYRDVVTMAVDALGTHGRAFVTEYAGPSAVIDPGSLQTDTLDPNALAGLEVVEVIEALEDQGLLECSTTQCIWFHELASSLVHEFLPVPAGVPEPEFYACLSCFEGLIDTEAWDRTAFIAAYEERIVAPLEHGAALLEVWPYVTRLYTTISPHEMLSDPMFAEHPELADVPRRHEAERTIECCGSKMRLPDGRTVWLDGGGWPSWSESMPWAEQVLEYAPGGGAPVVLTDDRDQIDAIVDLWNSTVECSSTGSGSTGPGGADDEGTGMDSGGGTVGVPSTSAGGAEGQPVDRLGCGCGQPREGTGWMMLLLGVGLGGVVRRRKVESTQPSG